MAKHIHIWLGRRTADYVRGGGVTAERPISTIYAGHPVAAVSKEALDSWARSQGFDMRGEAHVTIAASRQKIDTRRIPKMSGGWIIPAGGRTVEQFGDHLVLCLSCNELQKRHAEYKAAGASWDFPSYRPHITIGRVESLPPKEEIGVFDEPITLGPELLSTFDDY